MDNPASLFIKKSNAFYEFFLMYFKFVAIRNEYDYEINQAPAKGSYRIKINEGGKIKYYYFIYTSYNKKSDDTALIEAGEEYTNSKILEELVKNPADKDKSQHIIITLLFENEIRNLHIDRKDIKLSGEKDVNKIINDNKILFIDILSKVYKIEDLIDLIDEVTPAEREEYNEINQKIFLNLIRDLPYSLVLGAGVSIECGAKNWNGLLAAYSDKISDDKYVEDIDKVYGKVGDSNLIKAQLVKDVFNFNGKEYQYYDVLQQGLYPAGGKFDFEGAGSIQGSKTDYMLYHIARIMNKNKERKNFKVITYNYDDYLEFFINNILEEEYRFKYHSLFNGEMRLQNSLPIYHVHGFMPYQKYKTKIADKYMKSIVLTEKDYNELYNDSYRWEINVQLLTYRENICVFVGSSLTDPNIRRLIRIAKDSTKDDYRTHYALIRQDNEISQKDYAVIEKHFNKIGVKIIWTKDYGSEILSKMY